MEPRTTVVMLKVVMRSSVTSSGAPSAEMHQISDGCMIHGAGITVAVHRVVIRPCVNSSGAPAATTQIRLLSETCRWELPV